MKIRIVDDLNPEDEAMLQALYSRSAESVDVHLEKVKASGSGKFMSTFYVGYGHKSIADCGTTTMFIEGVSLLAAKAIQDWPLYNGQETSTRYINMSKQDIVDPIGTPESAVILDRWMKFYTSKQEAVGEILRAKYPKREEEKQTSYDGAIKARTFDILRGFLPAGITTQLSWHTNLRQAGDHLVGLANHPTQEIRDIAHGLRDELGARYPSSGGGLSLATASGVSNKDYEGHPSRRQWEAKVASEFTYSASVEPMPFSMESNFRTSKRYADMLATRPRGCVLPHFLTDLGQAHVECLLDFGSFRDWQRHRNGVCRMPLLTTYHSFEGWYLEQLEDLSTEASTLIQEQRLAIEKLNTNPIARQYYVALGFRVPINVTYSLPALLYVMELRTGKTVHPTLRKKMHMMVRSFQRDYPDIALHADLDPDDWDVRRGEQTITER